jgi:hypothetical protein
MLKFKSVDERFAELGFFKVHESEYGARYEKRCAKYVHVIAIVSKRTGKHVIQSYEKAVNKECFNNAVGMTELEASAALDKLRELKRKYKWGSTPR